MLVQPIALGLGLTCFAAFSWQYAWWRRPIDWSAPRVLMYHMVSEHRSGARFNKLRVPPRQFEKQLQWLTRNGFHFIFASQLFSGESLPPRSVCLTFDDGYADNLTQADPLLEKYNACATLYLVVHRDGGWSSKKKAHHSDDELAAEPKLSDAEVQQMVKSGRWELGGHTLTHANLCAIHDTEAIREIGESRNEIESRIGTAPQTFAYPFGIYDAKHAQMVESAGYTGAVTTESAIAEFPYNHPFEVPRVKVSGKEGLFAFSLRMGTARRGVLK